MKTNHKLIKNNLRASFILAVIGALLAFSGALAAAGSLDPTFGTNGFVITDLGSNSDTGDRLILSSNGSKIYALGSTVLNANRIPVITRYNSNGSLDNTYGTNGRLTIGISSLSVCDLATQSDGKLILGVSTSPGNITLLRYLSDGSTLDNTFGTNGTLVFSIGSEDRIGCADIAVQPDHKIVVVGSEITGQSNFTNIYAVRFNENGTKDFGIILDIFNFPNNRYNYGEAVSIQSDGKIVLSGSMMDNDGIGQISLARLNTDGLPDATFGTNGKGTVTAAVSSFNDHKSSLAIQPDGKLVVAGTASDINDIHNDLIVARFNTNGALDTAFGGTGIVTTDFGINEQGNEVVIQNDGRIIVVGKSFNDTSSDFLLARYNTNGSLDTTFGSNGKVISNLGSDAESGNGALIQPDGKLLVIGTSNNNLAIARFDMGSSGSSFSKQSPANGATGLDPVSVTLSWNAAPSNPYGYSQSYKYCYHTGSETCNFSGNLFTTHTTISNFIAGVTYYWQVEVVNCMDASCTNKVKTTANDGQEWSFRTTYIGVTISGNTGAGGATLNYTDGTLKTVTADGSGNYSLIVPYNWSGTVTPSKAECIFSTPSIQYTNIKSNQSNQNFTATCKPPAATLTAPSGNMGTNYNPTYSWNQVSTATWYLLQVNTNTPNKAVIYQWYTSAQAGCNGSTCSVTPATTLGGGAFTWWVLTNNSAGDGPWSAGKAFNTTIIPPLGPATLTSPSGNIGTNYNPIYTWNQVTDSTWYLLQVNRPSGTVIYQWYTSAQAGCNGSICSVTPSTTLGGGAYTWWILPNNSTGDGIWSAGMTFNTTTPGVLGPATQVSPSGGIGSVNSPIYTWSQVTGSTWYLLQVNGPSGAVVYQWYTLAQSNCNGTTCSVTPSASLPTGAYTWWVLTYSMMDGTWSSGLGFTVSP